MRPLVSYRDEGNEAYLDGVELKDCPYKEDTIRYFEWRAAWLRSSADDPLAWDDLGPRDPFDYSHPAEVARTDAWLAERSARFRIGRAKELLPTLADVAGALGAPENWAGNCYATSQKLKESGLLKALEKEFGEARLCYGVYTGEIHPDSMFAKAAFSRHGWLEFDEGIVVDPTYWVFAGEEPSIRVAGLEEYDLAASRLRQRIFNNTTPPAFDAEQGVVRWTVNDPDVTAFVEMLLGEHSRLNEGQISRGQAHWLGNRPLSALGSRAEELYVALKAVGLSALIPIDNRAYVGMDYDPDASVAKFI